MSVLERRKDISEAVLKDRFIRQQLLEESKEIDKAQTSLMARRGFRGQDWFSDRDINVEGNNKMVLRHLPKHRFVDMRTRVSKRGRNNKKSHPVHNKILFGHANNIIKRLHFGFTQAVKAELATDI